MLNYNLTNEKFGDDNNIIVLINFSWQVVDHYLNRVRGNIELMMQLDLIGRTSDLARLFGIIEFDFYDFT